MKLAHMITQAHLIQEDLPSYRIGQHFINLMGIDDSEDPQLQKLWNSCNEKEVMEIIHDLMDRYQWKENHMPVVKTCVYLGNSQWELKDAT